MVTPQSIRESWEVQSLPVVSGQVVIDGSSFYHGLVSANTNIDFNTVSGLTAEIKYVTVSAVSATRTVTVSGFSAKSNIPTAGIPIPSGTSGRFAMWANSTISSIQFLGYSDRGWAPEANTRLAYDTNRLPILLTASQEATALMATPEYKAKNVVVVELALGSDWTSAITVADGKDYFTIPEALNGYKLTRVQTTLVTPGTTGTMLVQIYNMNSAVDILSTRVTQASAATAGNGAAVINTSNNTATTDHRWRVDVDQVHTTPGKGGLLILEFTEP